MRWSQAQPYAVDLRSARATPAPPAVMVGYSARLALTTTFTGLIFSALRKLPDWSLSVISRSRAWSGPASGCSVRRVWQDPVARARVVTTTAA